MYDYTRQSNVLMHHGIKNQKWDLRRFQNPDGSLTPAGRERYRKGSESSGKSVTVKISEGASRFGKAAKAYVKKAEQKHQANKVAREERKKEKKELKELKKEAKKEKAAEKLKADRAKWLNDRDTINAHWNEMTDSEREAALKVLKKFDEYDGYRANQHKRIYDNTIRVTSVLKSIGEASSGIAKTADAYKSLKKLLDGDDDTADNKNSNNDKTDKSDKNESKDSTSGDSTKTKAEYERDLNMLRNTLNQVNGLNAINNILSTPKEQRQAALNDAKKYMEAHAEFFDKISKKAAKKKKS